MAEKQPEISADGKTITIKIRHGVHFSPPVNREVTLGRRRRMAWSASRARTWRTRTTGATRMAIKAWQSPPAVRSRHQNPRQVHARAQAHRTGGADRDRRDGPARKRPGAEDYAKKFDAKKTERIRQPPGRHGPVHAQGGLERQRAGSRLPTGQVGDARAQPQLEGPSTDYRPAYLDEIKFSIGGDTNVIGRQVLEGSHSVQNDTPAQAIVKLAYEKFRSQLQIRPAPAITTWRSTTRAGRSRT